VETTREILQRRCIQSAAIALTTRQRAGRQLARSPRVRLQSEPLEIFQNRLLVLGAAAAAIVIFQSKQYRTAECTSGTPDVNRVGDVTQVEVAGGTGGEASTRTKRNRVQASSTRLKTPLQFRSRSRPPRNSK
jgi:hypothetical protein